MSEVGQEPFLLAEDTVLNFPLAATAGLVEFEFEFESAKELGGGFAVISYELQGADGLDPATLGLTRSSKFGLCRQAWSRSSRGVVRQSILIPEGVGISGITLRGKNRQPADIFIRLREPRVVEVHGFV
jgi:hypothetical protein